MKFRTGGKDIPEKSRTIGLTQPTKVISEAVVANSLSDTKHWRETIFAF